MLIGDNGILQKSGQAKDWTEIAQVEESANLELASSLIDSMVENGAQKSLAEILQILKTRGEIEDYSQTGQTVITEITFGNEIDQNGVAVVIGAENAVEKTATFKSSDPSQDYYVQIKGKKYPVGIQNGKITIRKQEITLGRNPTGEITDVSSSDEDIAKVEKVSGTTDKIKLTGITSGQVTITVKYTEQIKTSFTLKSVKPITIIFDPMGGTLASGESGTRTGLPNATINLPTAPTPPSETPNYIFNGWYAATSGGNPIYAANATTGAVPVEATNNAVTYYAQWKEPKLAFRTYGTPVATDSVAGTYGTIGTSVQLNSGSAITVKGTNTIQDNWKVFYEDDSFVYLIYGDYYPAENVQTAQDTIQLKPSSSFAYGVTDSTSRVNLLKYLRNNSTYTWNFESPYGDNHGTNGSSYTSWSDLRTALNGLTSLSSKTIKIQGSPDIDLWVKSWNAKGNTELKAIKTRHGYKIMGASESSNSNYYINVKTNVTYNTTANETNHTGYYDTLYFPYTTQQSTANGYWIASPGGMDDNSTSMCGVVFNGKVGFNVSYGSTIDCARPVVAIAK